MMFSHTNRGFVKLIIIIVVIVIALSYFNIDIKGVIEAPQTQQNISYVWGWALNVWNNYLRAPVVYFWNDIFIKLLWSSFTDNLERIKGGQPHDFELNAPKGPEFELEAR